MNGKKAKAIRRELQAQGAYKKEAEYKTIRHLKNVYVTDPVTQVPKLRTIEKFQVINLSRQSYRQAKRAYKNGEMYV